MEWYTNRNNFLIELQRSDLLSVGSLRSRAHISAIEGTTRSISENVRNAAESKELKK